MSRNLVTSALDGIVQAVGMIAICVLIIFDPMLFFSVEQYLIASVVIAAISAGLYFLALFEEKNCKRIIWFTLGSISCFIICIALFFVTQLTLPIYVFPMHELNNGDGILILLSVGIYIMCSVALRLCILVGLLIRNWYQDKTSNLR